MSNMTTFIEASAVILDKLYREFPRRVALRDDSFGEGLNVEQQLIYRDTIHFLHNEGVLRYETWSTGRPISFEQVTLTAKGLDILLTPVDDTPSQPKTIGEQIGEFVKAATPEAARFIIREVISQITRRVGLELPQNS